MNQMTSTYLRAQVESSNFAILESSTILLGFDFKFLFKPQTIESFTSRRALKSLDKCKVEDAQSEMSRGEWHQTKKNSCQSKACLEAHWFGTHKTRVSPLYISRRPSQGSSRS